VGNVQKAKAKNKRTTKNGVAMAKRWSEGESERVTWDEKEAKKKEEREKR